MYLILLLVEMLSEFTQQNVNIIISWQPQHSIMVNKSTTKIKQKTTGVNSIVFSYTVL